MQELIEQSLTPIGLEYPWANQADLAGPALEIVVFSRDSSRANYEAILADIFGYSLAVSHEFGLPLFQQPAGMDCRLLAGHPTG